MNVIISLLYLLIMLIFKKVFYNLSLQPLGIIDYNEIIQIFFDLYSNSIRKHGWNQTISDNTKTVIEKTNTTNNILLLSNHVSLVDFLHYIYFTKVNYPTHKLVLVTKKDFTTIPLFGKLIHKYAIIIEDLNIKNNKRYNLELINKIINVKGKTIVIFFPEGKIYNKTNIERSNKWCHKNNIGTFTNCLCPHTKGLIKLLRYYRPDEVLISNIKYSDDYENIRGKEYYHLFMNNIPKKSIIDMKRINIIKKIYNKKNNFIFKDEFIKIWRNNHCGFT